MSRPGCINVLGDHRLVLTISLMSSPLPSILFSILTTWLDSSHAFTQIKRIFIFKQACVGRVFVVVAVSRPLLSDQNTMEDHEAPEVWQLPEAWTKSRIKKGGADERAAQSPKPDKTD